MFAKMFLSIFFVCFICVCIFGEATGREKRQLFRESVLPNQGGKIPDSAFIPERLTTNRLQQNGLYTIDGVILEQRNPERHLYKKKYPTPTIKINIPPDNEHVAFPGRSYSPRVIDTTYIIRDPVRFNLPPHQLVYFDQLPFPPQIRFVKRRPNDVYTNTAIQIFKEFQPYLKTIHAFD